MKIILLLGLTSLIPSLTWAAPAFDHGEVKILYPCSVLKELPREKEERETITFFERNKNELHRRGLIFRYIESNKGSELTVKFRAPDGEDLRVDSKIFRDLQNSHAGEVKCEVDATYDPQTPKEVRSCSFKSPTNYFINEHFIFMKMVHTKLPDFDGDLRDFRQVEVRSTSWKYDLTPEQKARSPLTKKPSIEMWVFGNECILEISGKFESPTTPKKAMDFVKSLTKAGPASIQGNKTGRVLGL